MLDPAARLHYLLLVLWLLLFRVLADEDGGCDCVGDLDLGVVELLLVVVLLLRDRIRTPGYEKKEKVKLQRARNLPRFSHGTLNP